MIECETCHRHIRASEGSCPFCRSTARTSLGISGATVMNLVGGALTTFVLAACYGGAPTDKSTTSGTTGDTGATSQTTP